MQHLIDKINVCNKIYIEYINVTMAVDTCKDILSNYDVNEQRTYLDLSISNRKIVIHKEMVTQLVSNILFQLEAKLDELKIEAEKLK
jgi:hypothetical protein